jgi:hypothetical protein
MYLTEEQKRDRENPKMNRDGPMHKRWSEAQIEKARRIVNDIAEFIDNGHSRHDLRMALAIYADMLWDSNAELQSLKSATLLERLQQIIAERNGTRTPQTDRVTPEGHQGAPGEAPA